MLFSKDENRVILRHNPLLHHVPFIDASLSYASSDMEIGIAS
jgi:hypothetical protein